MKKIDRADGHTIDDTDLQILSMLKANARIPVKQIAERTFLSPTAIATRIERLEQAGIIVGYEAKMDAKAFGFYIKAFVYVDVEPVQTKDFYSYVRGCNNVIECNCVTGDYAMILEVIFRTTEELERFVGELQHFGKTKTQIVFSTAVEHRDCFIEMK
jgi:Lrp/AsnC family leucine-responsive transcriptional regulator